MSPIMFIVQNGIGLGHLRRALLLAKEVEEHDNDARCFVLAQARSIALFAGQRISGITVPSLHTLPSKQLEVAYRIIVEEVVNTLRPKTIIEDTHPLLLLRQIETLRAVRRVLLIRRMTPLGLEEMRHYGELGWYHHLIYMDSLDSMDLLRFGGPINALMALSERFTLVSPIAATASDEEKRNVRARYRRAGEQLIVVSCGGGGDHEADDSAVRLFAQAQAAAALCLSCSLKQHWVFVTGPYYPQRDPQAICHVTWVDFEPMLPALLQEADVVVARPGFNVTHEALKGNARLVLIPCHSWHEAQEDWCASLSQYADVRVIPLGDVEGLSQVVSEQRMGLPARNMPDGRDAVITVIKQCALATNGAPTPGIHLVLLPEELADLRGAIVPACESTEVVMGTSILNVEDETWPQRPILWWGGDVGGLSREWLDRLSPCLILVDSQRISSWQLMASAFGAEGCGVLVRPAVVIRACELHARPSTVLDGLENISGPIAVALKAPLSELPAAQDLFRSLIIERGRRLMGKSSFVSLNIEEAWLPNCVSVENSDLTRDQCVAARWSPNPRSERCFDDEIDLSRITEGALRQIISELVTYLFRNRKVADLSGFCLSTGRISIKVFDGIVPPDNLN